MTIGPTTTSSTSVNFGPRTITLPLRDFVWYLVGASMLVGVMIACTATYYTNRWIDTTERATNNATYWMAEAKRCYSAVAPAVYLSERGYEIMRAATQRNVVIELDTEVDHD